jgi:hypothetical protein
MKPSRASAMLLAIQIVIVSSVAAKYFYERWTSPHVWTRGVIFGSQSTMGGRYFPITLKANGCGHMPPPGPTVILEKQFNFGAEDEEIALYPPPYQAKLRVSNNNLTAAWLPDDERSGTEVEVDYSQGGRCDVLLLVQPVPFYIPKRVEGRLSLRPGQELWIEVTLPPKGPPRPIQLALKDNGAWKPLAFQ